MRTKQIFIKNLFLFIATAMLISSCAHKPEHQLASPDKQISLHFNLDEGKPLYCISYKGDTVISPSELGLRLKNGIQLNGNFRVVQTKEKSVDNSWEPVWGIHDTYRNHYNELSLTLEKIEEPNYKLDLVFRVYNDGAAFRYHLPEQPEFSEFIIASEDTRIRFTEDHRFFGHVADKPGRYQEEHISESLSGIEPGAYVSMPLLVEANNCWVSVMEADLTDYAGMLLVRDSLEENCLVSRLDTTDVDNETVLVSGTVPHTSPWRVFMVSEKAGDFIESPLGYNLNDPCALDDVSWIKPGKVTWPWWNDRIVMGKYGVEGKTTDVPHGIKSSEPTTKVLKYFIDFAARNNIPYVQVDAGWYSLESDVWKDPAAEDVFTMEETRKDYYDVHEVIDYAQEKGVDVLLWLHLGSVLTKEKVDTVLAAFAEWGVKGIKPDYYEGEDQELVSHFHYLVKTAAKHKLMVDYHGSYKPTGFQRTYPNYITGEAIHGLEYSKWGETPTPGHNVIIPYTRMLCGPMDYTPGAFDLDGAEGFPKNVQTTRTQQMAMFVVYFSPLQMMVDYPHAYESAPEEFEFIKQVPTVWDKTLFLEGYPGEYVAVARKNGEDWFVGVMNNEQPDREVTVNFDFLDEGTEYTAHLYKDAPDADQNPQNVVVEQVKVTSGDDLSVAMASGGGAAIWLEAVE